MQLADVALDEMSHLFSHLSRKAGGMILVQTQRPEDQEH